MQKLAIEYLRHTCSRFPDKIAVVDGDRSITFAGLWRQSLTLAQQLAGRLDGSTGPVVIDIEKSIDAIVAIQAVQLSGSIYVPFDPDTPPVRRRAMLETLSDACVLGARDGVFELDGEPLAVPDPHPGSAPDEVERALLEGLVRRKNIDPLYIIFTSGTTGIPKGVTISNAAVIDYIEWAMKTYAVDEKEIIGNQAPLYFDNSVLDLYLTLACGCTLHLIPASKFLFANEVVDYLSRHEISFIFFVPSILSNFSVLDEFSGRDLSRLRKVLFAGEMMPVNTLKYLRAHLPGALLSNLYGPTEITVDAIYWIFDEDLSDLTRVPLGVPCENKSIVFVDGDGTPVHEKDEIAEICVAGIGVSLGYWNNPKRTAEVFVQNPCHDSYREVIYKTGDLGYVSADDGLIYMTGRKDNQIKHRGHRIELGEIEHALAGLNQIAQCCVLYDDDKKEIVAFYTVTGNGGALSNPQSLLADRLPRYMLPRRYLDREHMPTTRNGKIDRQALWVEYLKSRQ